MACHTRHRRAEPSEPATAAEPLPRLTLEMAFAGQGFANVDASPLPTAIACAADELPLDGTLDVDDMVRHFGCESLDAPSELALPTLGAAIGSALQAPGLRAPRDAGLSVRLATPKRAHGAMREPVIG
jgi:hypothetical protein